MLAVAGAAVTLGVMMLVLAAPALVACAPSGTPALACLSQSLRERLPFIDHGQTRAALVNPPLPPRDPRKARASVPADQPVDMPVTPTPPPALLKVDLPVLSPIGEARAAAPTPEPTPGTGAAVTAEATLVTHMPIVPAAALAVAPPSAPAIDPVTASTVPEEPAAGVDTVPPELPVTLPPNPKPPMPDPLAAASPLPDAPSQPIQPPATEAPVLPPTIDTIQIGGTDNFVAGDAPEGSTVRLYLDDQPVGESDVHEGRWLVEGVELGGAPLQMLTVDAIDIDTGERLGSGAISVEIELPDDKLVPPLEDAAVPGWVDTTGTAPLADAPAPMPEQPATVSPAEPSAPISQLVPPAAQAREPVAVPKALPPLAPVTLLRGSASVELLSGTGSGSFVTLGR